MKPHYLAYNMIAMLILQFFAIAQCVAQVGNVDLDRVAAAHAFLVESRTAEELLLDDKRYLPQSDDYVVQFGDKLSNEVARQKFREAFDRILSEIMGKATARFGELIDRYATVYARYFTVEELNAGTAFYRSPVGHKLLSSTATLADVLYGSYSAPEPERMQTARALVEMLKQTDPFTSALGTPAQAVAVGSGDDMKVRTDLLPEEQAEAEAGAAERLEKLTAFYARSFTVDELNSLLAFYRSPFARKMGNVQPKLDADIINLNAEWIEPFWTELETRLAEAVAEIANE